jgi:uncharacterized protein (TIGR02996 family)
MNDGESLLQAVRASPDDLTLRLVYSDWFEEQGDQPRADFIRLQLAPDGARRADKLLRRNRLRWDGPVLRRLNAGPLHGQVSSRKGPVHRWDYRRGFIEAVTVQPATFLAYGEEILQIGPINEVQFVHTSVDWEKVAASPLIDGLRTIRVHSALLPLPFARYGETVLSPLFPDFQVVAHWTGKEADNGPSVPRQRVLAGRNENRQIVLFW